MGEKTMNRMTSPWKAVTAVVLLAELLTTPASARPRHGCPPPPPEYTEVPAIDRSGPLLLGGSWSFPADSRGSVDPSHFNQGMALEDLRAQAVSTVARSFVHNGMVYTVDRDGAIISAAHSPSGVPGPLRDRVAELEDPPGGRR